MRKRISVLPKGRRHCHCCHHMRRVQSWKKELTKWNILTIFVECNFIFFFFFCSYSLDVLHLSLESHKFNNFRSGMLNDYVFYHVIHWTNWHQFSFWLFLCEKFRLTYARYTNTKGKWCAIFDLIRMRQTHAALVFHSSVNSIRCVDCCAFRRLNRLPTKW